MTDDHNAVVDMLRNQGFEVGKTEAHHPGIMRLWVSKDDLTVDVEVGRELRELAEGKLTLLEILKRRESEMKR